MSFIKTSSHPPSIKILCTILGFPCYNDSIVNGSYVINGSFDDNFYSEKVKKNIALVASLRRLLQQYKNTPLYESVGKLIYFLQPEVAKNDSVSITIWENLLSVC